MMNIKETFLKLTEYTIPFKHESKLEKYLPEGYKKDSVGNYYIEIGNSDTLFTTHLDTYSDKYEKVNHVIDGNIIKTDGTTILGGDNKLGMTIMLYMIDKGIPGTYFFFLGEEPIVSGGLFGSRNALISNPEYFKKFKRAIAFDRKEKGSVVRRQKGRFCCSEGFANALSSELTELGIHSAPDPKAYYTDTATFLDIIPECTNISAGGYNEHYTTEWVDLNYTIKVAEAACKINWDSLPTEREVTYFEPKFKVEPRHRFKNKATILGVKKILSRYDLLHTNNLEYSTYNTDTLVFNTWFEELNIRVTVLDNILLQIGSMDDVTFDTIQEFNIYLGSLLGIDISPKEYNLVMYEDGSCGVLNTQFASFEEYVDHFIDINPGNTSYVTRIGGAQYQDEFGLLPKELIIKWYTDNLLE